MHCGGFLEMQPKHSLVKQTSEQMFHSTKILLVFFLLE
jgi:hypothetical protein